MNHHCQLTGRRLTVSACRGKRSRIPPPLEGQLEAGWHRTMMGCVCQCDRPCACTGPSPRGRPRTACSPESPRRCPRHSSPLGSFSGGSEEKKMYFCTVVLLFLDIFTPNVEGSQCKNIAGETNGFKIMDKHFNFTLNQRSTHSLLQLCLCQ